MNGSVRRLICAAVVLYAPYIAFAQEDDITVETQAYVPMKLTEIDEAGRDEEFQSFRERLISAIKLKDVSLLMNYVGENIDLGGGQSGPDAFRRMWNLDSGPAESEIWSALYRVLELGGVFRREVFTAPYVYAKWPEEYPMDEFAVVTGRHVNLREEARSNSAPKGKLTYDIVKLANDDEPRVMEIIGNESYFWEKIILPNGETAYVYGKYLARPDGYFAQFRPTGDGWKMITFKKPESKGEEAVETSQPAIDFLDVEPVDPVE